jgi:hypothetical protein
MIKKYLAILIFTYSLNIFSQSDSFFHFIPMGLNLKDSSGINYMQLQFGFICTRVYKKNSFGDKNILCYIYDNSCETEFKIKDSDWYIKNGFKWTKLYSKSKNKMYSITFKNDYCISPITYSNKWNLSNLYGFVIERKRWYMSEGSIYWFDPQKGIVIIENSQFVLIRKDFLDEINSRNR